MLVNPVMFPPGRAKLSTSTSATGSDTPKKTMGIVLVAFLRARAPVVAGVTSTSTLRRISSSARAGSRSYLSSANRYSKAMFLPSTLPSLRNSRRNDSGPPLGPEGERAWSQPILGTFAGCCPRRNGLNRELNRAVKQQWFSYPYRPLFTAVHCQLSEPFCLSRGP
jgi:hypothetical protein